MSHDPVSHPHEKDPLGKHELAKDNPSVEREIDFREQRSKAQYDGLAEYAIHGTVDQAAGADSSLFQLRGLEYDTAMRAQRAAELNKMQSKPFFALDSSLNSVLSQPSVRARVETVKTRLATKGPASRAAVSALASLLTLTLAKPGTPGVLERSNLLIDYAAQAARYIDEVGGLDTIRTPDYSLGSSLVPVDLATERRAIEEGSVMKSLQATLANDAAFHMVADVLTWPDTEFWAGVRRSVERFDNKTLVDDSLSLLNLVGSVSPNSTAVEHPDIISSVTESFAKALEENIGLRMDKMEVQDALKQSLAPSMELFWAEGKPSSPSPTRKTMGFIMMSGIAGVADKYKI